MYKSYFGENLISRYIVDHLFFMTWTGSCIDGHVSGTGVLDVQGVLGREHYEGGMVSGKMDGVGLVRFVDGRTLSGDFHDGVIGSPVAYTQPDGTRYEGGWSHGSEEGGGIALYADHARYEGQWHEGKRSGHGILTLPNGLKYDGLFQNNVESGHGLVTSPAGDTLEGEWQDGHMNGHGTSLNKMGSRYDGDYVNTKRNGHGVYIWANGARYEGNWRDNAPDGEGVLTRADGSRYAGTWMHGCFRDGDRRMAAFVKLSSCS